MHDKSIRWSVCWSITFGVIFTAINRDRERVFQKMIAVKSNASDYLSRFRDVLIEYENDTLHSAAGMKFTDNCI